MYTKHSTSLVVFALLVSMLAVPTAIGDHPPQHGSNAVEAVPAMATDGYILDSQKTGPVNFVVRVLHAGENGLAGRCVDVREDFGDNVGLWWYDDLGTAVEQPNQKVTVLDFPAFECSYLKVVLQEPSLPSIYGAGFVVPIPTSEGPDWVRGAHNSFAWADATDVIVEPVGI